MKQRALVAIFAALCAASFGAAGCGPPQEGEVGKAVGPPQTIRCPEGQTLQAGACVAAPPQPAACPEGQVQKDGKCERASSGAAVSPAQPSATVAP